MPYLEEGAGAAFLTDIDRDTVLRFLGYKGGEIEKEYIDRIDYYSRLVLEKAMPRCEIMPWDIEVAETVRLLDSDVVLAGKDIAHHLEGCDMCCFVAATLGSETDRLIRQKSACDMTDAVIIDACASVAIENLCDNLERYLEKEYLKVGTYITDRFSPGYGDFPIEAQQDLCSLISSYKKIGLTCTRDFLLTPTKSITAVIGLSDSPREKRITGCGNCKMKNNCKYLKQGMTCYGNTEK